MRCIISECTSCAALYICKELIHLILVPYPFSFKQEPNSFNFAYEKIGTPFGGAQLRYNYYPMITDPGQIKPGQIRCGEHTDYGGITLLIQDDAGGLEVRDIHVKEYTYYVFCHTPTFSSWFSSKISLKLNGRGLNNGPLWLWMLEILNWILGLRDI